MIPYFNHPETGLVKRGVAFLVEATGEEPEPEGLRISVSGPSVAAQNVRAPYLFTLSGDTSGLKTMRLTINIKGSDADLFIGRAFEARGLFTLVGEDNYTERDGSVTHNVVLSYNLTPVNALAATEDILEMFVRTAAGRTGSITVTLREVEFNTGATGSIDTQAGSVETLVANRYDIDLDGDVDLDDIAAAQNFYQMTSASENWSAAERSDVNGDGQVDLQDLVAIANAYLDTLL